MCASRADFKASQPSVIKIKLENLVSVECLHLQELLTRITVHSSVTLCKAQSYYPRSWETTEGDGVQYKLTGFL